jgi:hypothetical protein
VSRTLAAASLSVVDSICSTRGFHHLGPEQIRTAPATLRQRREEPDRKLPEIEDVDVPIVVEVKRGEEAGLAGAQIECTREEPEVGDIDVPVAVIVTEEAEEARRRDGCGTNLYGANLVLREI